MATTKISFASRILQIVPRWLKTGTAARILWTIGLHCDAIADLVVYAVRKRFPVAGAFDALPLIGTERKMIRGPAETDEVYASRLATWLDAHKLRGNPYALLQQLHLYYAPNNFPIELVYASSAFQFKLAVDGTITWGYSNWEEPDGDTARWSRWRLIYHWPDTLPPPDIWDGPGAWDSFGVWDTSLSPEIIQQIKAIPEAWNAAHCEGCKVILVNGTPDTWDGVDTWDAGGPWTSDYDAVVEIAIA